MLALEDRAHKRRAVRKAVYCACVALLVSVLAHSVLRARYIYAENVEMTKVRFSNALFCQRVSQAINDSLGDGKADGSDCVNFNLYVSTAEIPNIKTLDIIPPENGWGSIDWSTQSISIGGQWVTVFASLQTLSITNMHVSDISPLSGLTAKLTYLDLSNNNIYNISPISVLKESLEYLNLSNNPIGDLRPLHDFTALDTLVLQNAGAPGLSPMFYPIDIQYDPETGEPSNLEKSQNGDYIYPTSSPLAKKLRVLDISHNPNYSYDKLEGDLYNYCTGGLEAFGEYAAELALQELDVEHDNLNSDDLFCIAKLENLTTLDASNNHIGDFNSIKDKPFEELAVHSQSFVRYTASLDYSPLQEVFSQAAETNYFTATKNTSNTPVPKNNLELTNAKFYEDDNVRFVNAAIAQQWAESPEPATVLIPSSSGVFAGTKLEVYFTGQVITFNDSNLCDRIYKQGESFSAFYDIDYNLTTREPVVLTNACFEPKKQIAMISGGSSYFVSLELDKVNKGAAVDLTGLDSFTSLQVLSLQGNALEDISKLQEMYNMQQLWLGDNKLENDDWWVITQKMYSLGILSLNNNKMSEIPDLIANLQRLGNLYLTNNGISDISPLAYVPSLTVLDISENPGITDISSLVQYNEDGSLASAANPTLLKSENTSLASVPSSQYITDGFSNLVSLNLNGNKITDATVANLKNADKLDELYLSSNSLTTTSGFSGISKLKKLFLDDNKITDVSGLTSLQKLAELHLAGNKISDLTGLNSLPALATLDIKDQTLEGNLEKGSATFTLPPVFSQAKTLTFSGVPTFPSTATYTVENGTLDSTKMTVSPTDSTKDVTVTIPDGGLSGTKITISSSSDSPDTLASIITNTASTVATVTPLSSTAFSVTSSSACAALYSADNGLTWTRLAPTSSSGASRTFAISSLTGARVNVSLSGDANGDGSLNVRDARKIVNSILGRDTLSALEETVSDVDGSPGVNVRDARAIVNSILGTKQLTW